MSETGLLNPASIRRIADQIGLRPTKTRGQNFVHDANTVRRIVSLALVGSEDRVIEVGPGLGSLTLGLLETGAQVVADLALSLGQQVAKADPETWGQFTVLDLDRLDGLIKEAGALYQAHLAGTIWGVILANLIPAAPFVILVMTPEATSTSTSRPASRTEIVRRSAADAGRAVK